MTDRPDYILFDTHTQAIVFGLQSAAIQRMLDFDYVCRRKLPSVTAIVNPAQAGQHKVFFGDIEILIPIYQTLAEAIQRHPTADTMINFASMRSAYDSTRQALHSDTLRSVTIIAEGIPERQARLLIAEANQRNKWILGPATVGGIVAGQFRIGNTAGTIENIIAAKLYRPGSVGFISKSGGMSNEMYSVIAKHTDGVYEGYAIGGDMFPGSTFLDHLLRYEANPNIKMHVLLGEVGGDYEYAVAEAMTSGQITKPVVAWVTGTCAREFPTEVQFGHAGARSGNDQESAAAKNQALRQAGATVPQSFNDFGEKIQAVYETVSDQPSESITTPQTAPEEIKPRHLPQDFAEALNTGAIRKPTDMITSISNDTGEEATYLDQPISEIAENQQLNLGYVIGLLWFKKQLPKFACQYIEMILKTVADHGPAVSGAHNTIVAARADKDLVSALASGLLTIGPKFGGAIDGAAVGFKDAYDRGLSPEEFVHEMKQQAKYIPGIGHKIKSTKNPDARVESLKQFARDHFASTALLDYALEVERITTSKKENLILNVDGCIGVTFVDMMLSLPDIFTAEEVAQAVEIGSLNGLFVLGRSIGLMGHYFDQKRLGQGLYRYPTHDILYLTNRRTNKKKHDQVNLH